MRGFILSATTAVLLLACAADLRGQWAADKGVVQGMFGPRVLGEPLRPGPRPFSDGILTGPAGEFRGRNPYSRSLMFPAQPLPRRHESIVPPPVAEPRGPIVSPPPSVRPEVPFRGDAVPDVPQPAGPAVRAVPEAPSRLAPEIWFRSSASSGEEALSPAPQVSTRPELGFRPRFPSDRQVSESLRAAVDRAAADRALSPITVSFYGGTATVHGRVVNRYDQRVLIAVVRMEPGVDRVNNELTIGPQPAATSSAAASADTGSIASRLPGDD